MKTMAAWAPAGEDMGEAGSRRAVVTVLTQVTHHPVHRRRGAVYTRHPARGGEKDHETTSDRCTLRNFQTVLDAPQDASLEGDTG